MNNGNLVVSWYKVRVNIIYLDAFEKEKALINQGFRNMVAHP
tara:strand:+ start:516 stop:641 length:126 start_codon:yes stop_codon:yes gene_type:complete